MDLVSYPWTRLEDVTQFIKRIIEANYNEKKKSTWTLDEIVREFEEWYGIQVDNRYFNSAVNILVKKGIIKKINNELIYLLGKA
jgi:hypothetical protein